jgi:organic radical activating enzyme
VSEQGQAAPPRPAEGAVSWNLTRACNYRCSYCTQRLVDDRGRSAEDLPRFLAAFARLPGRWEIKLSGGEPLQHPGLDSLVAGLAGLGHRISLVTNFSASRRRLQALIEAAAGRVGVVSCSLHPEYVKDPIAFFAEAGWLAGELLRRHDAALPRPTVSVSVVATRAILPRLRSLAAEASSAGLVLKLQPEKQDRDVIPYTAEEQALILELGGHNLSGRIAHSLAGRPCWAGSRYFILDDRGRAHRCYPERRWRRDLVEDFLAPGFRLAEEAAPCLYPYCNCTVPIARGMVSTEDREP